MVMIGGFCGLAVTGLSLGSVALGWVRGRVYRVVILCMGWLFGFLGSACACA